LTYSKTLSLFRTSILLKNSFLSYLIALLLTSCTAYQYVAPPPYIAQHQKRGELKANVYPSGIQIGYSPANHLAVFGTACYREWPGGRGNPKDHENMSRHREYTMSEFAIGTGYFGKVDHFTVEVLVGGGLGTMDYTNSRTKLYAYKFEMKANTRNVYIQPAIGWKTFNGLFTFAVFTKLNFCRYSNVAVTYSPGVYAEPEFADQEFMYRDGVDLLTLSPGVSFFGGWRSLKLMKLHAQVSPNFKLSDNEVRQQWVNINVGVSFSLDRLKWRKNDSGS
jgi:hypothetical protein